MRHFRDMKLLGRLKLIRIHMQNPMHGEKARNIVLSNAGCRQELLHERHQFCICTNFLKS